MYNLPTHAPIRAVDAASAGAFRYAGLAVANEMTILRLARAALRVLPDAIDHLSLIYR